ncbi:MAG TPA: cysteine desulfurase family protein, partial [Phycisphaerae bacterium]|nr:cysteine desulfurase family protein [Phycisphaerae bacterium]
VFTSGGSEANNHAVKGVAFAAGEGHVIISAVEHPAIAVPARWLTDHGFDLTVVGVDSTGLVDPDDIRRAIRPDTILISIMLANNEVGTIQPIAEIARMARSAEVLMHTDAAQAVGKIRTTVNDLGVDLLTVAGHKLHAPPGVGALYIRAETELEPLIHGAGHENGRRAGTEAVPAIVGLGAAAELCSPYLRDETIRELRDRFHTGLIEALGDRVVLNGHPTLRLPNTLNVSFRGQVGVELLGEMENVCASPGAACHSDRPEPSAVLSAMGVDRELALGAVRFSLGRFNTEAEVDEAVGEVVRVVNA